MPYKQLWIQATSLVFGIIGFGLIWYFTCGWVALGIFLAMWGNNISKHV